MIRYIFLDGEMGGRDLKFSLLTSSFIVTDETFNELGRLHLNVKPDDGAYLLTGPGMGVNKIDIVLHDKIAITYNNAKGILYDFLKSMTQNYKFKLVPVGHAVKGDIEFVHKYLLSTGSWFQACTYHYIDTSCLLQFLRACGKMPIDIDGSVSAMASYFGVLNESNYSKLHDSMFDTEMTCKVYQKMLELGKN
jgi:DNA polymerase III epsilon subunit-like protein